MKRSCNFRNEMHNIMKMIGMVMLLALSTLATKAGNSLDRIPRQTSSNTDGGEFQTEPRRAVVRPGESVTLLGNAETPLQECHFYLPGRSGLHLDFSRGPDSRASEQYEYFGRGLDSGECGIRIKMADEEDDGLVECRVKLEEGGSWESSVTTLRVTNVPVSDLPVFDIEPPKRATLSRGDDVTITCNADREISLCRFYLPGPRHLNLDRGRNSSTGRGVRYHGSGLEYGDCGVALTAVDRALDGYVVCKVGRGSTSVGGAWETDALKVTVTNGSRRGSSRDTTTTLRPTQTTGRRSTPSPDENRYPDSGGAARQPARSSGGGPSPNYSTDENRYPDSGVPARQPTRSGGGGSSPNYSTDDNRYPDSGVPARQPARSGVGGPSPNYSTGSSDTEECGRVKLMPAALITNGQGTEQGQWPWHVAIYQNQGKDLSYICGGSLISKSAVVTAAHCVTQRPSERLVKADTLVLYFGKYRRLVWSEGGVQNKQIEKIHVHPTYNGTNLRGDIAVIILKSAVEYTDYVRHVCLWESSRTELKEVVGKEGTVVGWGYDESGESPPELMMARMPVVNQQTCIWSYQEFFSQFTSNRTLCAGFRNGTSVCNGDSGGGLVFSTKQRDNSLEWHLRALVSLSAPKGATRICDPHHYVVFTDVAQYLPWLSPFVS